MKGVGYYIWLLIIISGVNAVIFCVCAPPCIDQKEKCIDTIFVFQHIPDSSLTLENVQQELLKHDIKYPEIVYRQVCWETGWLTSKNCLERNNLTGMKGGEITSDNPEGYKIYSTWQHSIRGYARWQRRWYGDSTEDYYSFLIRIRYAKDPEQYVNNLKSLNTNWHGN